MTPPKPGMSEKQRMMITGLRVLWSGIIYIPAGLPAVALLDLMRWFVPLFPESADQTPPSPVAQFAWALFLIIVVPLILRSQVLRPRHQLARLCGDPRVFKTHCHHTARLALPYTPALAAPIACLAVDWGDWFCLVQIGTLMGADRWIDARRRQPIEQTVAAILSRNTPA